MIIWLLCILTAGFFLLLWGIYLYTFRKPGKNHREMAEVRALRYESSFPDIVKNIEKVSRAEYETVETFSRDGLRLRARLYCPFENAPIVLFFHGYKSSSFRDFSGGFECCMEMGVNMLLPDQRGHGLSEGKTITFGIKESMDCLCWIEFCRERFGVDAKILLMGVSMGASTVVMASGRGVPDNVVGVVADCGFSSPKDVICHVIKRRSLPVKVTYALTKLAAIIFGGFNPESYSSQIAAKAMKIPLLLIHGTKDGFVPAEMSEKVMKACEGECTLLKVEGANHGLSYYKDTKSYKEALYRFSEHTHFV